MNSNGFHLEKMISGPNVYLPALDSLPGPGNSLLALLMLTTTYMLMVRPGGKREAVYQAVWADNKDFDQVLISKCMVQVREKYDKMLRGKRRWVGEGEGEGGRGR